MCVMCRGGFDVIVVRLRLSAARTPVEVMDMAAALKKENPNRSAAQVRRILLVANGWAPDERTLQRMFTRTGLTALATAPPAGTASFGRVQADPPNELWPRDALHRPLV